MSDEHMSEYDYVMQHASSEPDIYFDEPKAPEVSKRSDGVRLVMATIIDASNGNTKKLQAIMCLFAGLSLRESSVICSRSHEWVRKVSIGIERSHPELYGVITNNVRGTVQCLIPSVKRVEYVIKDTNDDTQVVVANLSKWCRDNDYKYGNASMSLSCGYKFLSRYVITKRIADVT